MFNIIFSIVLFLLVVYNVWFYRRVKKTHHALSLAKLSHEDMISKQTREIGKIKIKQTGYDKEVEYLKTKLSKIENIKHDVKPLTELKNKIVKLSGALNEIYKNLIIVESATKNNSNQLQQITADINKQSKK